MYILSCCEERHEALRMYSIGSNPEFCEIPLAPLHVGMGRIAGCKQIVNNRRLNKRARYIQCIFEVLINFHDGSLIAASVAVIWCYIRQQCVDVDNTI